MSRRHLPLFLMILTLLPVPVLAMLGERGLGSLEAADLRLRGEQARILLLKDLRQSLPSLSRERKLPLNESDRIAVLDQPEGRFLVAPALMRARALREQDRIAEALDAIDPSLRGHADPNERAAALVLAADLLSEAGHRERARQCWVQAISEASEEGVRPVVRRWIELRSTGEEGLEGAGGGIERGLLDWCEELCGRPASLEELVLMRELLRGLDATDPVHRFVAERLHWPEWCAEFRQSLWNGGVPGACLARIRSGWFVCDAAQQSLQKVDRLEQWLAAWTDGAGASAELGDSDRRSDAGTATLNGVVTTGPLTIDWGPSSVRIALPPSELFGTLDPRLLLGAGLLLYALLSVMLVAAVSRQQRRSEQLVAARDDLIAQVTHELRTPLTVLRMYGETLLAGRVSTSGRQEYLETIVSESVRLGALVDRIAAVARDEFRDEPLNDQVSVNDLEPVLRQVIHQYHSVVRGKGGRVRLEPVLGPPSRVRIDVDDFRLILEVLVDNAVRYGAPPPEVVVRHSSREGSLIVEVCDRGEGLSDQEREQVFERWARGRAGRRSGSRGAGMGLHLARKLARRQGGDVTLESVPKRGTLARIWLPLAREGDPKCSAS